MSARKVKTAREAKVKAPLYLKKAGDNHKAMLSACENGNYNAAATLAVQCAISAADAVCVHECGIRSLSQNHLDVCELIKTVPLPESNDKSSTLKRIISKKNLIQYESRSICKKEAEDIVKYADRFYKWSLLVTRTGGNAQG